MRMTRRGSLASAVLVSLLAVAPPQVSFAKKDPSSQTEEKKKKKESKRQQQRDASISRDRAASIARSATGGRVLRVDRRGSSYRVKVLVDGKRVRTVGVDARSGAVSK
jgi:uncharacterized membrane protein YkoI